MECKTVDILVDLTNNVGLLHAVAILMIAFVLTVMLGRIWIWTFLQLVDKGYKNKILWDAAIGFLAGLPLIFTITKILNIIP